MSFSNLPGDRANPEKGMMCDNHDDRLAVTRIQGETDSMGAEYMYFCQECLDRQDARPVEKIAGPCEWCKREDSDLRPTRDIDEGSSGPVYYCCLPCIRKQAKELQAELDAYDD